MCVFRVRNGLNNSAKPAKAPAKQPTNAKRQHKMALILLVVAVVCTLLCVAWKGVKKGSFLIGTEKQRGKSSGAKASLFLQVMCD